MEELEKAIAALKELAYEDFAPHMGIEIINDDGKKTTYAEEVLKARDLVLVVLTNCRRELLSRTDKLID